MSKKTTKKGTRRKKLIRTFVRASLLTLLVCVVLGGGIMWAYQTFIHHDGSTGSWIGGNKPGKEDKEEQIEKTVAVFGTDIDGYRTDVIFVVRFNSETNHVNVVSIPRDTRVEWTVAQQEAMQREKGYSRKISKINEMTAYVGIENIRDYTVAQIEALLGIKIDNYVIVTLDAFRKVVDAIGGVYVDVPRDMYYRDSVQGLYIDLKKGPQLLDGEKAEMLVRYRKGYAQGDVGRIETQQIFLEAFAEKILSPGVITKIPQLVSVMFNSITTDIDLNEILSYYGYVKNVDLDEIEFGIIPGEGRYIGNISYYLPNMSEMPEFVQKMFYDLGPENETSEQDEEVRINKNLSIEILNGSGVAGAAANAKATLERDGYKVSKIGNYEDGSLSMTKILAKDIKNAIQFKTYYPQAVLVEDRTLTRDIQILLGR